MLRIDVITIFPQMFFPFLNESIIKRAQKKKKVKIFIHDLRLYSRDKHKKVDDKPFGGGPGMVLCAQPIFDAVKKIKSRRKSKVILMAPSGKTLKQDTARVLSKEKNIILICGHYEGVDERVREYCADECISIGDYVLTGGEIPALVLMDCLIRLVPGVLGCPESLESESFEQGVLEYPQYTRPANFRGEIVPNVLLSGDHQAIKQWRYQKAVSNTKKWRPDLLKKKKK